MAATPPVAPRESKAVAMQPIQPSLMTRLVAGFQGFRSGYFPPLQPMAPIAPDTAGRQFDYPTGVNLRIPPKSPDGGLSFVDLRALADGYDLLRLVIETRKDQVESYRWDIKAKDGLVLPDETLKTAQRFFRRPDGVNLWSQWLRIMLEELLVIDTVCIYPRMKRGGGLYSLELVDGSTIRRVIDYYGRTPTPDEGPAYQQVLKGLPTADFKANELCYFMRNPRVHKMYGYSPVEQVVATVNIALRRQTHIIQYYTEGNVPEALVAVPETWSADQIKIYQTWWDSIMSGNTAERRRMRFVPKSDIVFTKSDETLKSEFDEWLARLICYAFSVSPSMLVQQQNRATAQQTAETAKQEGLIPLLNTMKSWFDYLLQDWYGLEDAEFRWDAQNKLSPLDQATVDKTYVESGIWLPDEVREVQGKPALPTPEHIDPNTEEPVPHPTDMETGKPVPIGMRPKGTGGPPPLLPKPEEKGGLPNKGAGASETGSAKDTGK